MEETAIMGRGLFRFGISEERLTRWPDIGKRANMKAKIRAGLMKVARAQGANPGDWYGTMTCVAVDELNIQAMLPDSRKWTDLDLVRGATE